MRSKTNNYFGVCMKRGFFECAMTVCFGLCVASPAFALSKAEDKDRDGMNDKWEVANGLNPKRNDANLDKDKDGLTNKKSFSSEPRRTTPTPTTTI